MRQASVRDLEKRAGAVRQAESARRQSMLFVAGHLAERPIEPLRQKHGVITESCRSARRPNQRAVDPRLEFFAVSVRPGNTKSRDKMCGALIWGRRAAGLQ